MHQRQYLAFALAGSLLAAPVSVFAQNAAAPASSSTVPAGPAHHMRGGALRRALETLELSDDQKARVREFMKSYRALRESASPQTREQLRANIEGVLTPDQRARFIAALRAQARARNEGAQAPQTAPTS